MKEDKEHTELTDLIIKKMNNEASQADLDQLNVLLGSDPSHQALHDQIVGAWELSVKAKGITHLEIEQEWSRLDTAIKDLSVKKNSFPKMRLAAVILLLLVSSFVVFQLFFDASEVTIVAHELMEKRLADGSNVTLRADAQLTFSDDFNQERREVSLRGEAFFDVAPDADRPFIIKAEQTAIRVLGTSFNVKAKKKDVVTEIVVVSGKVEVIYQSSLVVLLPGEKAIVNKKSGKIFKVENDDPNFQSWKTKSFIFSDLPLVEVVTVLSQVYDVQMILKHDALANCPVTVSFEDRSLESILKVITNTLDLTIEKTGNQIILSGKGCE